MPNANRMVRPSFQRYHFFQKLLPAVCDMHFFSLFVVRCSTHQFVPCKRQSVLFHINGILWLAFLLEWSLYMQDKTFCVAQLRFCSIFSMQSLFNVLLLDIQLSKYTKDRLLMHETSSKNVIVTALPLYYWVLLLHRLHIFRLMGLENQYCPLVKYSQGL